VLKYIELNKNAIVDLILKNILINAAKLQIIDSTCNIKVNKCLLWRLI